MSSILPGLFIVSPRRATYPSTGNTQQQWASAEEEKLRLYEEARAQVVKVQGLGSTPVCSR